VIGRAPWAGRSETLAPLVGAQALPATLIDVSLVHPVAQARLRDPDVGGDLRDRLGMLPGQLDRPAPELRDGPVAFGLLSEEGIGLLRVGVRPTGASSKRV
jgi:hypothetical protein